MFELCLRARGAAVEALSDWLVEELDALSVSVEDADADSAAEVALYGEPGLPAAEEAWASSTLRVLFERAEQADAAAAALLARGAGSGGGDVGAIRLVSLQAIADTDWVRLTQSQFEPVAISPGFWIVPSWHHAPAGAERVIRLDPGLAFGTGTHPTTRMCLRWIARHAAQAGPAPQRVLDYGCGSGILAIAAALHGAREVDAVDIDPAAVAATAVNARANAVRIASGLPATANGRYDWVLANILAVPLKLLAPLLTAHLAPGGWLVLAGVLSRQLEDLQAAYAPWVALQHGDEDDGWVLLLGHCAAGARVDGLADR